MSFEIKVPVLPESVTDATVAKWYKKIGEKINRDENLVDLETDKVMLEVPAPQAGVIEKIFVNEGTTVTANQILAIIGEESLAAKAEEKVMGERFIEPSAPKSKESPAQAAVLEVPPVAVPPELGPAVRRKIADSKVDITQVQGTGKSGRITKQDIENYIQAQQAAVQPAKVIPTAIPSVTPSVTPPSAAPSTAEMIGARNERRVPMTRLRARIAERLLQSQHQAALLTTFNEVNMKPIMDLRKQYRDQFEQVHGVRLGLMSFFTKAVIEALKRFPVINASIDENDIIYHDFYDIGIAIGSPRGLVVPIIRNAESMGMANIEKQIKDFATRAEQGKLSIEEMMGGTFTITNGGTYGSMLSTPIVNPPQGAILGMHKITERPVVENGTIVIRPMMYLALSYDHRIIDGSDSVRFLVTVKELIEDPARLLLEV